MEENKDLGQEAQEAEEEIQIESLEEPEEAPLEEEVSEEAGEEGASAEEEAPVQEAVETDQEPGQEAEPGKARTGLFKKKEKKDKRDEQIAELTDKVKRQLAEFENFRNRTEKEKSQMYTIGARDVIDKILPVVDNFERGIKAIPEAEKESAVADGMEKIYKQLVAVLTDLGVTPIEAVGQEFDPNLHNAVMHVEDEELGENVVAEEFQKGYQYRDAVLRHSMVKVAN